MLIAKIIGGIGNQLFQYAFIRSLAIKHNQNYKLDLSWFNDYYKFEDPKNPNAATRREYLLNCFKIDQNILPKYYLRIAHRVNKKKSFFTKFPMITYFKFDIVYEKDFLNDEIDFRQNLYFSGFWQKTDIFENYKSVFKSEFVPRKNLTLENSLLFEKIINTKSVSIHIRRGDLLNRPAAAADQPYSTNEYFINAIDIIREKIDDINLFIFSDDINWVKRNIHYDHPTVYVDNDGPDYEHLYLMSNCKYNIISNSTYSWWAAWLNNYKNKIIVSPKWWYRNPIKNESVIRIPNDWIILNNIKGNMDLKI